MKRKPLRTCIGCGRVRSQQELVRIVRSPAGEIFLDPSTKAQGRGAYLCQALECFTEAKKRKRFSKALRILVNEEKIENLKINFETRLPSRQRREANGGQGKINEQKK